jgi:hypothetical protein
MDSETAEFGFIANEFKCPQADFAFVCPYPNIMFNVSYTNNLKRPIIINKWWDESLQNRLHKILGKVLIKDGVSSGLTTGGVLKDSFQDKSFYILGNAVSFCCAWRLWFFGVYPRYYGGCWDSIIY